MDTTPLPDDQVPVLVGTHRNRSGSTGPFFAVMSVIVVLSVLACIFGRFFASWAEGPDGWYDCLGWAGRRCRIDCCCLRREVRAAVAVDLNPRSGGAAVAVDLNPKIRGGKQLPLNSS